MRGMFHHVQAITRAPQHCRISKSRLVGGLLIVCTISAAAVLTWQAGCASSSGALLSSSANMISSAGVLPPPGGAGPATCSAASWRGSSAGVQDATVLMSVDPSAPEHMRRSIELPPAPAATPADRRPAAACRKTGARTLPDCCAGGPSRHCLLVLAAHPLLWSSGVAPRRRCLLRSNSCRLPPSQANILLCGFERCTRKIAPCYR